MVIGRSVVVGVGRSPESRDAARLGRVLSMAAQGALHLVTAVNDPLSDVAAVRLRLDAENLHVSLLERARRATAENLRGLFDAEELAEILTVRLGRPEHVLSEAGDELDADVFVLGGRRHGPPGSWIRRGTAHHLLRTGNRPVLVTGPEGPDIRRVLVAVDLSFAARPTIEAACTVAEILGAPLEALHVVGYSDLPEGWNASLHVDSIHEEAETLAAEKVWPLLPDEASRRILRGAPVPTIRDAAEAEEATLLVLGAQGRGRIHRLLLGSTTEALLDLLPSSLMVIPIPPEPKDGSATNHHPS